MVLLANHFGPIDPQLSFLESLTGLTAVTLRHPHLFCAAPCSSAKRGAAGKSSAVPNKERLHPEIFCAKNGSEKVQQWYISCLKGWSLFISDFNTRVPKKIENLKHTPRSPRVLGQLLCERFN